MACWTASTDRRASCGIGCLFMISGVAGLALAAAFLVGAPTPLQGLLVLLALGAMGVAIVLWSHRLLPQREYVEVRRPLSSTPDAPRLVADSLVAERGISRRRLLRWLLYSSVGSFAVASLAPFLSLGPPPPNKSQTAWRSGLRLVDQDGQPVLAGDLPLDSDRIVFPEGAPGDPLAQTVLIHVNPTELRLPSDRADWAPNGFVAYSRVCTHAGCPVALYRRSDQLLICPCHQSTFQVLEGAQPVFGPAARGLPQLPLALQADGSLVAMGDFSGPVGPSTWDVHADQA
jgi:ubiquinol-cytochrome c reductase iron-sulfur subunit